MEIDDRWRSLNEISWYDFKEQQLQNYTKFVTFDKILWRYGGWRYACHRWYTGTSTIDVELPWIIDRSGPRWHFIWIRVSPKVDHIAGYLHLHLHSTPITRFHIRMGKYSFLWTLKIIPQNPTMTFRLGVHQHSDQWLLVLGCDVLWLPSQQNWFDSLQDTTTFLCPKKLSCFLLGDFPFKFHLELTRNN